MLSPFSLARRLWRALPGRGRLSRLRFVARLQAKAQAFAHADEVYDPTYYDAVDSLATGSMPVIAGTLARESAPASVLDVGCGSGGLLAALREIGIPGMGVAHSAAGLAACRAWGLEVRAADLRADVAIPERRFGAATSLEVAEHLPPDRADALVHLLTAASDVVLFTAAGRAARGT